MSHTKNAIIDGDDYIMDRPAVLAWTGLPAAELEAMLFVGLFPKPVQDDIWYAPDVYNWNDPREPCDSGGVNDAEDLVDHSPF